MILTKLYSNLDEKFTPIEFNLGLNIIIGEIRLPENLNKDTHNLGKSTLASLIDYCLLKERSQTFFLFKHLNIFKDFIFFLEIEYVKDKYLTIKRSVANNSKISFRKHTEKNQKFIYLSDDEWTHLNLPIKKAKLELDSILNLEVVKPWDYRKPVSYALRSQDDYADVFQLKKFVKHIEWKPYLSKLLGLDSNLVRDQYEFKDSFEKAKILKKNLKNELTGFTNSLDKLEGLILIKEAEADKIKEQLNNFDFEIEESKVNKELVEEIDNKMSNLNKEKYYLISAIENLSKSLNREKIIFSTIETKVIFEEAGVLFSGQIKKTYNELIKFNKDITTERRGYLKDELTESQGNLKNLEKSITSLNKKRIKALFFLKDSTTLDKYKELSNKLVKIETGILSLKIQEDKLVAYEDAKIKEEEYKNKIINNKKLIANNVKASKDKESVYSQIKLNFNAIIKEILDKEALISISQNREGNLDFKEEILDTDGHETSESDGHTYKKLLCMAFDLAVNQVYKDTQYSKFIYHDGFLENLDDRKKEKFIQLIRKISSNQIQYIGTLIDSELPNRDKSIFNAKEIKSILHDDSHSGRLFKIPSF